MWLVWWCVEIRLLEALEGLCVHLHELHFPGTLTVLSWPPWLLVSSGVLFEYKRDTHSKALLYLMLILTLAPVLWISKTANEIALSFLRHVTMWTLSPSDNTEADLTRIRDFG